MVFVRLECQRAGTHMFPHMLVDKVKDSVWVIAGGWVTPSSVAVCGGDRNAAGRRGCMCLAQELLKRRTYLSHLPGRGKEGQV